METPALKVCGTPLGTDASRVMACLFEKEIQFQHIPMPVGRTTVIFEKHGRKCGIESRRFCRYACENWREKGNRELYGRNPLAKACIDEWLETEMECFESPSSDLVFHLALRPLMRMKPDEGWIKHKLEELGKVLDVYDKRLGESRYLAGDEFSLADLFHLPNAQFLVAATESAPLFTSSPNISRWWNDISSRHSWKKVVQLQQHYSCCN